MENSQRTINSKTNKMEKKKNSTITYKKEEKTLDKSVEKIVIKPVLFKKKYTLITDVNINNIIYKKGCIFELTKEGSQYFKKQFYI
jgi:hypothetical protein